MSSIAHSGPQLDELQKLANDPELARQSLAAIARALTNEDEETRNWAIEALENMGPPPLEESDGIVDWTRQHSTLVACWGCKLIGRLEENANRYQQDLVRLVQSHDSLEVRQEAAAALGKLGTLGTQTREILSSISDDHDPRLKRMIARALASSV